MASRTNQGTVETPKLNIRFKSSDDNDYSTRILIVSLIILFLLFTYYLIGGFTRTCECGESFQNCHCDKSDKYSRKYHDYRDHYDYHNHHDYNKKQFTSNMYGPLDY